MIESHKHRIGYQAWQLCAGNAAMREDLKQEAWLACLEYLERHPERDTVPTVRIRGAMIDHLRKVLGRGNNIPVLVPLEDHTDAYSEERITQAYLDIASMPDADREYVIDYLEAGSGVALAKRKDVTESAVSSRVKGILNRAGKPIRIPPDRATPTTRTGADDTTMTPAEKKRKWKEQGTRLIQALSRIRAWHEQQAARYTINEMTKLTGWSKNKVWGDINKPAA